MQCAGFRLLILLFFEQIYIYKYAWLEADIFYAELQQATLLWFVLRISAFASCALSRRDTLLSLGTCLPQVSAAKGGYVASIWLPHGLLLDFFFPFSDLCAYFSPPLRAATQRLEV